MRPIAQPRAVHSPQTTPRYAPTGQPDRPIRLFESDALEALTHIHPGVVLAIWTPVVAWFVWRSLDAAALSAGEVGLALLIGLVMWSLTEYAMHRFVFHFEPKVHHGIVDRLLFLFHGNHHLQPQVKTRLVMPPLASAPLAALFYLAFSLAGTGLGRAQWTDAVFAGFIAGYVCYDMLHYAAHHLPARNAVLKALKRYHMQHHYQTPDVRFGVSSPVWDVVFGTYPNDADSSDIRSAS